MSVNYIYSIFDNAAKNYGTPHTARTDAEAIRQFANVVNEPNNVINQTPDDFTLFRIAAFDNNTGEIIPEPPTKITNGVECKKLTDKFELEEQLS